MNIGTYSNLSGHPSVTEILSPFVDTKWFKNEDAYRGNYVHNALRNHCLGVWMPSHPEEYKGYIESGISWIQENVQDILLVEFPS